MSWQEEYVARYEAGLREKWANNGYRIGCEVSYKDISPTAQTLLPQPEHPTMKGVPKLTWSAEEIARTLGLSIQFIRNEMHAGHLLSHKYGRRRLVRTQDLEAYVERGSEGSKTNKDNYSTE